MKHSKLNKKVFGNLSLSLITSILCLAFLIIGLSASTIAIFQDEETYSFVTVKTGKIELGVAIEKINEEELFENTINEVASNENNELNKEAPYTYTIGDDGNGTYKVTIKNLTNQNGYFTATIFEAVEESEEEQNDTPETLDSFITEITQEEISFKIFTTKKLTLKLDNLTWDKTAKDDDKYISNENLAQKEFSYGEINVVFNPGFLLLPEGYEELSYISLNQEKIGEFEEQDKTLYLGNSNISSLVDEDKVIPFIRPVSSIQGMYLVACKDSNGLGGFYDTESQTFYPLNDFNENIVLGPVVFEDNMDTSDFDYPFEYNSENVGLSLPTCGYSRLGYTFAYYSYNDENVTNLAFDAIKEKAINNQDGTIEIIVCWTPNKIEIYDEEGNTLEKTYTSEDDISSLINPLTKENSTFKGYEIINANSTIELSDVEDLIYWKNLIDNNPLIKLKPIFEINEE